MYVVVLGAAVSCVARVVMIDRGGGEERGCFDFLVVRERATGQALSIILFIVAVTCFSAAGRLLCAPPLVALCTVINVPGLSGVVP